MTEHFGNRLVTKIRDKKSFLCLGLDPHIPLIPDIFNVNNKKLSLFENNYQKVENFCFALFECSLDLIPAIKPQIALFEQLGPQGMLLLATLCRKAKNKDVLLIMDLKIFKSNC